METALHKLLGLLFGLIIGNTVKRLWCLGRDVLVFLQVQPTRLMVLLYLSILRASIQTALDLDLFMFKGMHLNRLFTCKIPLVCGSLLMTLTVEIDSWNVVVYSIVMMLCDPVG